MEAISFFLKDNGDNLDYPHYLAKDTSKSVELGNLFGQKFHFEANNSEDLPLIKYSNPNNPEPDLLVAGCSFTRGAGLDDYQTSWGVQLSKMLGTDFINISQDGMSTDLIAIYITSYLYRAKNKPKYIALLLPDITRFCSLEETHSPFDLVPRNITDRKGLGCPPVKYSKAPHEIEQVISLEYAMHITLRSFSFLVQQCELLEIPLVWGTWDVLSGEFYKMILENHSPIVLGNYIDLPYYFDIGGKHQETLPSICHLEQKEMFKDNFTLGNDKAAHAGVHYHIHWAEAFYASLKK